MSTGSLLLGTALIILVALFLTKPLLLSSRHQLRRRTARQELLSQKESVLAQIEILDFDYETATLPELDYKQQRRQLVAQAADILQKLDAYSDVPEPAADGVVSNEIETAVAALRRPRVRQTPTTAQPTAVVKPQAPVPQTTTAKPVAANGQVKFCSQCGQPIDPGDKFCASCGNKIIRV